MGSCRWQMNLAWIVIFLVYVHSENGKTHLQAILQARDSSINLLRPVDMNF
jgi:hypothetical protein